MGLDQFALSRNPESGEVTEFRTWRKRHDLHNWMENLWQTKGRPFMHEKSQQFNCVPLELSNEDLDALEKDLVEFRLTEDQDRLVNYLDFVREAREYLDSGLQVAYDSWW
jgi:hypothetical protein